MSNYLVLFYKTTPSAHSKNLLWHVTERADSPSEALVLAERRLAPDLDADCIEVKRIADDPRATGNDDRLLPQSA